AGATDGVVVTNRRFHADFLRWRDAVECDLPLEIVDDGATSNETRLGAVRDLALALREGTARLGDEDVDAYLVLGCDNLFEFDLGRMIDRFAASGCGQLLVRRVPTPVPPAKYSEVVLAENGRRVARFREKPADPQSDLSAIAAYLLPADLPTLVQRHLDDGGPSDAPGHFIAGLVEAGLVESRPVEAHLLDGAFFDIGTPEDLERARRT
ncbi:MAG: nucleotidyltransferase family protein, partial [Planctomycetota bacterium]